MWSKGDLMKKLDMVRNVDTAIPIHFVKQLIELGFDRCEVTSHFVMDYRGEKRGDYTPLTVFGYVLLNKIEKALGWCDMPRPEKVVDLNTGKVVMM